MKVVKAAYKMQMQEHLSLTDSAAILLKVIRSRLLEANVDLDFVINMDQTPVYHAMNAKYTIHQKNEKTINLCTSAADTKRGTVAVMITASGKRVKSMVVFKGMLIVAL